MSAVVHTYQDKRGSGDDRWFKAYQSAPNTTHDTRCIICFPYADSARGWLTICLRCMESYNC